MTIQPHSLAPIKNHTEKSHDGVRLGEQAVKSHPAHSKGIHTRSVTVCVFCFFGVFLPRFFFSHPAWLLFF
jgi:hypothetical protein